ncbi:MAG: AAA family ATPase [Rhodothermaceae bacterium]|nr:AAA family ATPase [Rhodothermaceae bacterium]MYE63309.1 AAA family ATPase [Rhodothermaceae bacterium]MYJ19972.1 AAA family ATPase [Rhodothermaceae bacterium]
MQSNFVSESGARWMRCDLHVHSPLDDTKRFGENIRQATTTDSNPALMAKFAEKFVRACKKADGDKGLDLVALTDHNSIDGYRYLKPHFDSLAQSAPDQGLEIPVILPGVEFSVGGERPIHFLVIFSKDTCASVIKNVIRHVFGQRHPFDPETNTPQATGDSVATFLDRLYDYCRPSTGERNLKFVLLPAHVDGNSGLATETGSYNVENSGNIMEEMKGHLRKQVITRKDWHGFETARPFKQLPQAFQDLLLRWEAARRGSEWEKLTNDQRKQYQNQKHWPLVRGSDAGTYEQIGRRFSWLKMETPDVEGIRLALLDPESRLRRMEDSLPSLSYTHLKRITVKGTDYFEDIEIPLSPCLTTFIGGRGSGKSTLVEYIRYVLDRNRSEDLPDQSIDVRETVQPTILSNKEERDFGHTKGTLLPDHQITVDLATGERVYQIRRNQSGIRIIQDTDQEKSKSIQLDIRSLLAPRILSQRQIAQIALDPASQRHELDALIESDLLRDIKEDQKTLRKTLRKLQLTRKQLIESRSRVPEVITELQKISDQISFIERDGRREVFAHFDEMKQQHMWLDDALKEIKSLAGELMDSAEEIEKLGEEGYELPALITENTWINTVADRIRKTRNSTVVALREQNRALLALRDQIHSERKKNWQPEYDQARQKYDTLMEEIKNRGLMPTNHEQLLQRRRQLERERDSLQTIESELERVENKIRDAQAGLEAAYKKRFKARQEQAQALKELDADVRLKILAFRDRNDFEPKREQWFGGAGLQERDWRILCDYIFEIEGNVPIRLHKLLRALRADIYSSAQLGKAIDATDSKVVSLLQQNNLTGNFFNALTRKDRIRLDEMEQFLPEDLVQTQVRANDGSFKTIESGSIGEKSTAVLSLLLSAGDQPIIIDQPEDDLDNQYVYNVVVDLVRRRKFGRQIIIATHNANIPVNGDAELIVALGAEDRMGKVLGVGSIDRPEMKEHVTTIMEGSAKAFRLRRERYGY